MLRLAFSGQAGCWPRAMCLPGRRQRWEQLAPSAGPSNSEAWTWMSSCFLTFPLTYLQLPQVPHLRDEGTPMVPALRGCRDKWGCTHSAPHRPETQQVPSKALRKEKVRNKVRGRRSKAPYFWELWPLLGGRGGPSDACVFVVRRSRQHGDVSLPGHIQGQMKAAWGQVVGCGILSLID